jgi:hypothetical protein
MQPADASATCSATTHIRHVNTLVVYQVDSPLCKVPTDSKHPPFCVFFLTIQALPSAPHTTRSRGGPGAARTVESGMGTGRRLNLAPPRARLCIHSAKKQLESGRFAVTSKEAAAAMTHGDQHFQSSLGLHQDLDVMHGCCARQ